MNSHRLLNQFRKNSRVFWIAVFAVVFGLIPSNKSLGNLEQKYLSELTADGESVSNRYRYAFFLYRQERFAEALDQLDSVFSVNPVHAPSKELAASIDEVRKIRNETKRVRKMAMFMLDQVERAIKPDGKRPNIVTSPPPQLAGQDTGGESSPIANAQQPQSGEPLKKMVVRMNTSPSNQVPSTEVVATEPNKRTPSSVFTMPSNKEIKDQLEARYNVKKNLATQYEMDMGEDKFNFEVQRLFIANKYAKAQNAAVKWIKKYPNSPRARAAYVQALIERNQFQQANKQVVSMLKYFPNDLRLKVINDGIKRLLQTRDPERVKGEKDLLEKQLAALNPYKGVVQQ